MAHALERTRWLYPHEQVSDASSSSLGFRRWLDRTRKVRHGYNAACRLREALGNDSVNDGEKCFRILTLETLRQARSVEGFEVKLVQAVGGTSGVNGAKALSDVMQSPVGSGGLSELVDQKKHNIAASVLQKLGY